jgi:hypothetical protein
MSTSNDTGSLSLAKGGPATQEGKEVVKWNAVQHGIRSPAPVVPGVEKHEDWEEHRDGILESLSPEGHLELVLAERVALLSWRLRRVIRYETESITQYQERVEDDLARQRRFESGPDHPEAVRGNAKSDRDDHRLLKRFAKMEDDKALSALDADSIIWVTMECADKVAEGEVDPEELLGTISVSGLPDSDSWEGYKGWTAGLVRAVIEKVAQATDEEPEELLEAAIRSAQWKAERSKLEAEKVEGILETWLGSASCRTRRPCRRLQGMRPTSPGSSTRASMSWRLCRLGARAVWLLWLGWTLTD